MGTRSGARVAFAVAIALAAGLTWVAPSATPARAATVRNVPGDYATIQAAINAAVDGDTVLVAAGTYAENLLVTESITVASEAGAALTTIDGVTTDPVVSINTQQTETPTVRGFTITGGSATFGGGVSLSGAGDATLQDNVITGNVAQGVGGGLFINGGGSSVIERNVIASNTAQQGSGIGVINSMSPTVRNTIVARNTGAAQGGGLYLSVPSGSLGPTFRSNTIADNTATTGPGMYSTGWDGVVTLRNNIVSGPTTAPTLYCEPGADGASPVAVSNDIHNSSGAESGGTCAGIETTDFNVSVDPGYVNPDAGDYHLRPDSPLIDAGASDPTLTDDIDGDARPHDGDEDTIAGMDIGADEATDPLLIDPAVNSFGDVELGDSAEASVTLENLGSTSLEITTADVGGPQAADFAETSDTCTANTLLVGESCVVTVEFMPTAGGLREALLTITGPGVTGTRRVDLDGNGLDPILVGSPLDFGDVPLATSATPKFTQLNNYGSSPVTVTSVTISGPNAADFSIEAEDCTASPVPTAQACLASVGFTPTALGLRSATLTYTGPFPVGTRTVGLGGVGVLGASGISWGSVYKPGSSYTWTYGNALGRTVEDGTQRLHQGYATDRIGGAWAKDTGGPYAGIYYTRGSSGSTWSSPRRITTTSKHAIRFGLAASGSRVYVAYVTQTRIYNYSPTAPRVLYVRRNTNHGSGSSWQTSVRLTGTTGRVDYPTIAASGYDVHVAWTNSITGDIIVATSKDRGVTFTKRVVGTTSVNSPSGYAGLPSVAVSGSTVAVTWVSDMSGTVRTRVSADRGSTWGTTETHPSSSFGEVHTAVRSSKVAVAWTGPDGVIVRVRTAGTWGEARIVAPWAGYDQYSPAVALQDPDRVAVSWAVEGETEGWSSLKWSESSNGGSLWYQPQTIASSVTTSRRSNDYPSVLWPIAGTRYVTWHGWTAGTTSYRLYLRKGSGAPAGVTTSAAVIGVETAARRADAVAPPRWEFLERR